MLWIMSRKSGKTFVGEALEAATDAYCHRNDGPSTHAFVPEGAVLLCGLRWSSESCHEDWALCETGTEKHELRVKSSISSAVWELSG